MKYINIKQTYWKYEIIGDPFFSPIALCCFYKESGSSTQKGKEAGCHEKQGDKATELLGEEGGITETETQSQSP